MQKPTCENCPYWEKWHPVEDSDHKYMGRCNKYAPGKNPQIDEVSWDFSCGEHPHFEYWAVAERQLRDMVLCYKYWDKDYWIIKAKLSIDDHPFEEYHPLTGFEDLDRKILKFDGGPPLHVQSIAQVSEIMENWPAGLKWQISRHSKEEDIPSPPKEKPVTLWRLWQ